MWRAAIVISLAIGFALPSANSGRAQIAMPQPISTPVPNEWRAPFEGFLRELKVADTGALVAKTGTFQIGGVWQKDWILFRIEDLKTCHEDMCLTIIGRIMNDKFIANAMFLAGKHFTRGDVFVPMFGFQALPALLISSKISVTLLEAPTGWMVFPAVTQKGVTDILPEK